LIIFFNDSFNKELKKGNNGMPHSAALPAEGRFGVGGYTKFFLSKI